MKLSEICAPQVHDLLQIDAHSLTADSVSQPPWVRDTLSSCPWVVVRRGRAPAGQIAIGVRGATRSERWAGFCGETLIKKIVRPAELLVLSRNSAHIRRTPALQGPAGGHREVARPYLAVGTDGKVALGSHYHTAFCFASLDFGSSEHRSPSS